MFSTTSFVLAIPLIVIGGAFFLLGLAKRIDTDGDLYRRVIGGCFGGAGAALILPLIRHFGG